MEATVAVPTTANTQFAEIDRLFNLQFSNKAAMKNTTASDRKKKLAKLKDVVLANRQGIRDALYKDLRKSEVEADFTEVYSIVSEIRHNIGSLKEWMRPKSVETPLMYIGSSAKVIHEAKGNCLIISPWNYPIQLALQSLVSAIAAGNTVIIKPSEFTPNSAAVLKKIVQQAFAENEAAVITGDVEVSTYLLKKKFDHIHFTGSPAVGKIVMKAAAEHLTSVTLELGGKSPAIIDDTANIDAAVKKLVFGKFVNLGQTCIAPDYILIDEKKKEEFVAKFKTQLTTSFGENPQQSSDLARIINERNYQRLCSILEDAINKGAKIEVGGQCSAADRYISPTLLSNVTNDMRIMQEEIFGPLFPLITFKKIDEALQFVNSKEKPLALYVFSEKDKNQDFVISNTTAGGSCINDNIIQFAHPYLPFGGVNNSGIGKSHGKYGFKDFSHERAVFKALHRWSVTTPLWFPYGKLAKNVVELMIKFF